MGLLGTGSYIVARDPEGSLKDLLLSGCEFFINGLEGHNGNSFHAVTIPYTSYSPRWLAEGPFKLEPSLQLLLFGFAVFVMSLFVMLCCVPIFFWCERVGGWVFCAIFTIFQARLCRGASRLALLYHVWGKVHAVLRALRFPQLLQNLVSVPSFAPLLNDCKYCSPRSLASPWCSTLAKSSSNAVGAYVVACAPVWH